MTVPSCSKVGFKSHYRRDGTCTLGLGKVDDDLTTTEPSENRRMESGICRERLVVQCSHPQSKIGATTESVRNSYRTRKKDILRPTQGQLVTPETSIRYTKEKVILQPTHDDETLQLKVSSTGINNWSMHVLEFRV